MISAIDAVSSKLSDVCISTRLPLGEKWVTRTQKCHTRFKFAIYLWRLKKCFKSGVPGKHFITRIDKTFEKSLQWVKRLQEANPSWGCARWAHVVSQEAKTCLFHEQLLPPEGPRLPQEEESFTSIFHLLSCALTDKLEEFIYPYNFSCWNNTFAILLVEVSR